MEAGHKKTAPLGLFEGEGSGEWAFGAGVEPPSCPVYAPKQKVGGKAPSVGLADEGASALLHTAAQTLAATKVGWQTPELVLSLQHKGHHSREASAAQAHFGSASASTKRLGSALHPKGSFNVFSLFCCFVLRIMIDSPLATILKSWLQS